MTGDMTILDTNVDQTLENALYPSDSTSDNVRGIYFAAFATASIGGALVAVNAQTGATIASTTTSQPIFALGFDSTLDTIFALTLIPPIGVQLYAINPTSLALKFLANVGVGLLPAGNGGTYDNVHQVMYAFLANEKQTPFIIGVSVTTGKIVSTIGLGPSATIGDLFFDSNLVRFTSLAQNATGNTNYFLASMNVQTGKTQGLFGIPVATNLYYLAASTVASSTRLYHAVLTNSGTGANLLANLNLDTGAVSQVPVTWDNTPSDLEYVTWT